MKNFDCVVIGGGMVGAASALSLSQLGLQVALVEQHMPANFIKEQALDLRVSAISIGGTLTQLNGGLIALHRVQQKVRKLGRFPQTNRQQS